MTATVQTGLHFNLVRLASLGALLFLQVLFKGIRRLSLPFEVIRMVVLNLGQPYFEDISARGEDGNRT
jgi:hypothetical protein